MPNCICCAQPAKYSIQLAIGPKRGRDEEYYYLPNKFARENGPLHERWFCPEHMRAIEDNVRSTIQYYQAENGVDPIRFSAPS